MKKFKFDKYLLFSIILTIVGFGVIFGLSGIYPFGSHSITLLDFDGGYIPVYYKLWDVLHFKSTPLFDWNLGTGLNSFGSLIGNGFISPLCWIIAIFPRESVPHTISYVYLLKMVFITVMAYIGIGKIMPKTEGKYKMIFSLLYSVSAFSFLMSTNLLYLDSIALFPILVYSLKELLDKGKWRLYMIILTLTLLMNYYIAWLDLLFIVFTTGLYLLIMKPDNRKEKAVKVLVCTLMSLFISCILFLPGFMLARSSARMANNTSDATIFKYFKDKFIYLMTMAIPFVLTVKQLFVKKDKKINKFILAMLIMIMIGVFIEPINAWWHTGSHSGFPLRYGFEILYVTILASIYYLNNNYKSIKKSNIQRLIIPCFILFIYLVIYFKTYNLLYETCYFVSGNVPTGSFISLLFLFVLLIICYVFILRNDKKKAYILTIVLLAIQSISFGYLFEQFSIEETAVGMQKIKDNFKLEKDNYNYVINESSNINFPYILEVPSIENRLHFVRQEELDQRDYLGFAGTDTLINSSGGNVFTNAIMMNKYYFSQYRQETKLYDLIDKKGSTYYLKSKYNLSYLIPYNGKDYNEKNEDVFDNSNQIYKTLFDGKNNIYNKVDYNLNNGDYTINVKKGHVYQGRLTFDQDKIDELTALGIDIDLSFKYEDGLLKDYYDFATDEFGGLFGFESNVDGTIKLHLEYVKEISFYELNLDEFTSFINKYGNQDVKVETSGSTKTYYYNAKEDTSVLLPVNYTDEYEITVNGEKVDYKCNLYNMISIDVKKGQNTIEVKFTQKWFSLGIKITIISLVLFCVLYLINKKVRLLDKKIILWPLFILSFIAFIAFVLKIYILAFF